MKLSDELMTLASTIMIIVRCYHDGSILFIIDPSSVILFLLDPFLQISVPALQLFRQVWTTTVLRINEVFLKMSADPSSAGKYLSISGLRTF